MTTAGIPNTFAKQAFILGIVGKGNRSCLLIPTCLTKLDRSVIEDKLKIGGIVFSVHFVPEIFNENKRLWGELDFQNTTLQIWEALNSQQKEATLCHEIIHAIAEANEVNLTEHETGLMGNSLYQVLKDNNLNFKP